MLGATRSRRQNVELVEWLGEYNAGWCEDFIHPERFDEYAYVRERSPVPIAAGLMAVQVVMPFRQHAQHRRVIFGPDTNESPVVDRDDRGRARIVGVVLVCALVVEHPHPRRQLRRHVQHGLARGDELLCQQCAQATRSFDRPHPR